MVTQYNNIAPTPVYATEDDERTFSYGQSSAAPGLDEEILLGACRSEHKCMLLQISLYALCYTAVSIGKWELQMLCETCGIIDLVCIHFQKL